MLAALATLFHPCILVSSTTVMCDGVDVGILDLGGGLWVEGTKVKSFARFRAPRYWSPWQCDQILRACLIPLLAAYSCAMIVGWENGVRAC